MFFANFTTVNKFFDGITAVKAIKIFALTTKKLTILAFDNLPAVNIYFYSFTTIKTIYIFAYME
jgi:hypothetical protein